MCSTYNAGILCNVIKMLTKSIFSRVDLCYHRKECYLILKAVVSNALDMQI